MLEPWTLLIATHAIAATSAISIGLVQVVRTKRGDLVHRVIGRSWAGLMYIVSITGLLIGGYEGALNMFLKALSVWMIISLSAGIYYACKGNIATHRGFMFGAYSGLIGALIGVVAAPSRRIPSYFHAYPIPMTVIALSITIVSVLLVWSVWRYGKRSVRAREDSW